MRRVLVVLLAGVGLLVGIVAPASAAPTRLMSAPAAALGSWDSVTPSADGTGVAVSGWAIDPNSATAASQVHVYVGGRGSVSIADRPRPDVNAALRITGQHGFQATVGLEPGSNQVCAYAISGTGAGSTSLGCRSVERPLSRPAAGSLDNLAVSTDGRQVALTGWALDPNAPSVSTEVHLYVGGVGSVRRADRPRSDVNAVLGVPGQHGFSETVDLAIGSNRVCAYAISATGGPSTTLGCRLVEGSPFRAVLGSLDEVAVTDGGETARVAGWAYDPNAANGLAHLHLYVNGVGQVLVADRPRPDVNTALGLRGPHGFSFPVRLRVGANEICLWAVSTISGGSTPLGCRTVTGKSRDTVAGSLDAVIPSPDGSRVTLTGWAFDSDHVSRAAQVMITTRPVENTYVNDRDRVYADANRPRPDVNNALGVPGDHGFQVEVPVEPGRIEVCVEALAVGYNRPRILGCQEVQGRRAQPLVSEMVPSMGASSGGTEVAIRGLNLAQVQGVMFGSSSALGTRQVNDQLILVTAPPLPAGRDVPVTVSGPDVSAVSPVRYATVASPDGVPAITDLSPGQGGDGTVVTVTGTGLATVQEIWFIGSGVPSVRAGDVTVRSDTTIRLTVPAVSDLGAGSYTVSLITSGGVATAPRPFWAP